MLGVSQCAALAAAAGMADNAIVNARVCMGQWCYLVADNHIVRSPHTAQDVALLEQLEVQFSNAVNAIV